MLNTTCQKWTTSRFDHQKQKIYVKCSEDGDQTDEVKMYYRKISFVSYFNPGEFNRQNEYSS